MISSDFITENQRKNGWWKHSPGTTPEPDAPTSKGFFLFVDFFLPDLEHIFCNTINTVKRRIFTNGEESVEKFPISTERNLKERSNNETLVG